MTLDPRYFGHSLIMPVYAIEPDPNETGAFRCVQIVGTCSFIGGGVFLTAGHVVQALGSLDRGAIQVIDPGAGVAHAVEILAQEVLHPDIGLLKASIPDPVRPWLRGVPWLNARLGLWDRVRSLGYPYGLLKDGDSTSSLLRGFEGHVVSTLDEHLPLGMDRPPFHVYEVSFAVPRGLSGAPLLDARDLERFSGAVGIVIGNSKSNILVHRQTDIETAPGSPAIQRTIEQYESLTLGVAIRTSWLIDIKSDLLGATLGDHLGKHGLLLPPRDRP